MGTTYLDPKGSQIGKKESIADTAKVLGSMYEGIEYRGFGQEIVEELAKYAGVPVWNGLTNEISSDPDAGGYADHSGKLTEDSKASNWSIWVMQDIIWEILT